MKIEPPEPGIEKTMKICDFSDCVADAYFTTFCDKINKQIVVYEKFKPFTFTAPSFFKDENKTELEPRWVKKIRYFYMDACTKQFTLYL